MTTELKTYTRLKPAVLALQLTPGVEDNWIAVDRNGRELSRASTIDAVQHAAPEAAGFNPILDLPGLQGQPLNMGDYVINDGDGVFFTMPKDTFEELFGEGEGKEIKAIEKGASKRQPDVGKYQGEDITLDIALDALDARDETIAKLQPAYDELLKIAEMTGEAADPFVARETIDLWRRAYASQPQTNTDGSSAATKLSTATGDGTSGDAPSPTEPGSTQPNPAPTEQSASGPNTSTPAKTEDPLDHDQNGKKGGSKPKAAAKSTGKPAE